MSKRNRRALRQWARVLTVPQLIGALSVLGALFLSYGLLNGSGGLFGKAIPTWGHVVGVVVLFIVGLCSLLCSIELKDLSHPSGRHDRDEFRTVLSPEQVARRSGSHRSLASGGPANSSDRHRKIVQL